MHINDSGDESEGNICGVSHPGIPGVNTTTPILILPGILQILCVLRSRTHVRGLKDFLAS